MVFQILLILNLKRMSCKACLSAGRVSINDTSDMVGTIPYGIGARLTFSV
jgi:hypothetical protein